LKIDKERKYNPMADNHCPNKEKAKAKETRDGTMLCGQIGRNVKICRGRCSDGGCSRKR